MGAEGTLFLTVDGSEVDPAVPAVPSADRGFAYGDGLFRTVRLRAGQVAAWSRHLRKIEVDCRSLGLDEPNADLIERSLGSIAARHPDCVVRITVTAGQGARGYRRLAGTALTTVVRATATPEWPAQFALDGVPVHLCRLRLGHQPALAGIKHLNRLEQVLARAEWTDPAVPEGLTLDIAGNAVCGTMSNLFIVSAGRLATPDLTRCGVAGVQRERILAWAQANAIDVGVETVCRERLLAADALLLSNSVFGCWWVNRIGKQRFNPPDWLGALQSALEQDDPA